MKNTIRKILILLGFIPYLYLSAQAPFLENRDILNIENWKFSKGLNNQGQHLELNDSSWNSVMVPHTFSMDAINDIGYYKGQVWYRTTLEIPKSMYGKRVFIRFEGVGQEAVVYLNGKKVGKHIGGYSAFCFEITDDIEFNSENLIAVNVTNAPNFKRIPVDDALFNHYGGIYRPVHVFATPQCNISPLYFASSGVFVEVKNVTKNNSEIEVRTHISNLSSQNNLKLKYVIKNAENKIVLESEKPYSKTDSVVVNRFNIDNPILWNGKINPHQYSIEVQLIHDKSVDKVIQKFGVKTFKVEADTGFVLNHRNYSLHGVCKHQEWKQTGPAVTNEQLKKDMELIDEIGATSLRLSHYQHSDKAYQLADDSGVLVWAEIPYVHDWSGREGGNAKQQLKELILQNYNHPSIIVWGLWNEVRAWDGEKTPAVVLTKSLQKLAHKLDKNRLTISASDRGMVSNMGGITDLQAWNKYFGWYTKSTNGLATWLDTSHKEHPNVSISISEYGAGGNIKHQDIKALQKPKGYYFPEMEQTKYHEDSYKILKDRPYVWSTFVWNMFDFSVASWNRGGTRNLNHKGLVTFDRKEKKDAFYFYKANWNKSPMLYISERRHNIRDNEVTTIKVYTNLKKVSLYLNNKKIDTQKLTSDINIIRFKDVKLKKGDNVIKVISEDEFLKLDDEVIWKLKG